MNRRKRFHCPIADRDVAIALRPGGRTDEPRRMYVRCDERDCQYVDTNLPPCPLTIEMFDDGTDARVRAHLAEHAGAPVCYGCLTTTLRLSHDQVRRAGWRLRDEDGASIEAVRCTRCRRRSVSIALGERAVSARPGVTAPARPDPEPERGLRAVMEFLAETPGEAFCASCIAFANDLALADSRAVVDRLAAEAGCERGHGTCSACNRVQTVVSARGGWTAR